MTSFMPSDPTGILEGTKEHEFYDPTDEERELVSALEVKWHESYRNRLVWEQQWDLNQRYLKGEQVARNLTTGDVFRIPAEYTHRLLANNNVLRPTNRALLGKLTRNIPTARVLPPTDDIDDTNAAEIAGTLLQHIRRTEKLDKKYIDLYRTVLNRGTGMMKLYWDRNGGDNAAVCPEDDCGFKDRDVDLVGEYCPQCQDSMQMEVDEKNRSAMAEFEMANQDAMSLEEEFPYEPPELEEPDEAPVMIEKSDGAIRIESVDPLEIFIDPSATDIEAAQWWCHRVAKPLNQVREMFPEKAKYLHREENVYTESHTSLVRSTTTLQANYKILENHLYLFEFHERPTTENPKGRIIWMANGIILEESPHPSFSLAGRFPLYTFFWERNSNELWGESWIEQAWPLQRELNILLTQKREHRELTNRPKLMVPEGANIPIEEIDTTAGQLIYYSRMFGEPHYLEIPAMPTYVDREEDRLKANIREQASVTSDEAGETSSEASGRYAAILESQSAQQVGPILRYNAPEWIDLHHGILALAQEYVPEDFTWTVYGSGRPRTYAFYDMNLKPGYDIDIQEDDSLSNNHSIRLNQAFQAWDRNLFVDPNTGKPDRRAFLAVSGMKIPGEGPDLHSPQRRWASHIPKMLEHGVNYEPEDFDSPTIFEEELRLWLLGPGRHEENAQLKAKVKPIWQHYLERTQAAAQQQQAAMQQAQGGKPGGGGGGGQPQAPGQDPSAMAEAGQIVQNADQEAEAQARTQPNHEG